MNFARRDAIRMLLTAAGSGALASAGLPAVGQTPRTLDIALLGFQLADHIPGTAAVIEGIPAIPGYAAPNVTRIEQVRALASDIVAGSAQFGAAEITAALTAAEQGADLKVLGYFYRNTSQVFVVNSQQIKGYKDLENPNNVVAVNGKGAIEYCMLLGPLIKAGVDPSKVSTVEVGGSGSRMRALISGRVQAVPVHFDQAEELAGQGPFKVLFTPWTFYKKWVHEVWIARGDWLKKPENARAAVDVIKATTLAFRRANRDFNWYLDMYRKYATIPTAKTTTDASLRPIWSKLSAEVGEWPDTNILTAADFQALIPLYKEAGDITGTLNIESIVDPSYAAIAMKELGKRGL